METFLREVPDYRALCVWPDVGDIAARIESLAGEDQSALTAAARSFGDVEHRVLGKEQPAD